jgi:hypothetical protein
MEGETVTAHGTLFYRYTGHHRTEVLLQCLAGDIPRFEDFAAPPAFRGTNAKPKLSSPHAWRYRTRLREGAKAKPNYAGIHNLVLWGCGTNCRYGAVVNAVTGRVVFLPEPFSGPDIYYRPDSHLLILTGLRGETELFCFYDFDGRDFRLVKAIDQNPEAGYVWPLMACGGRLGTEHLQERKLVIVRNSPGGPATQFEKAKAELDRSETTIRIEGECHSACTFYLSAKKVCIADTAVIGVHGAARQGKVDAALTQEWARKHHPPALRAWAEKAGAYNSHEIMTIKAPDLWVMGFERCPPLPDDIKRDLARLKARERAELFEAVKRQWAPPEEP